MQKDMELEKRKTHDLAEQLQEKSRQFSKLQVRYDSLFLSSYLKILNYILFSLNNN